MLKYHRLLFMVLVSVLLGLPAFGDSWEVADVQQGANSGRARAHFISFQPTFSEASGAEPAERIPRPMRYVAPESPFSLMREQAQQDPAVRDSVLHPSYLDAIIKNIPSISYHGSSPSDTTIAVGPTQVVVAVNTSVAVYMKAGGKISQRRFEDFFSAFDEVRGADFFDPKLAYDQYGGHFIFIVDAYRDSDRRSWYMVVVSKTSDVRQGWVGWALDMQLNGSSKTTHWADYPGLGYDTQAIYVTANMFSVNDSFQYAKLRILRKSEVYSFASNLGWYDFWQLKDASGAKTFTLQPVRSIGSTGAESMVSCNSSSGSALTVWTLSNPTAAAPQLTKRKVSVPGFKTAYNYSAEQKGGGSYLDVADSRLSDAVNRDGTIYVGHTIQKNWGSGIVSALRIYKLSSTGGLQESMTFGADNAYYFYPAVTADPKGNMIVVFDRSSTAEFAGVRFTSQPPGQTDFLPSTLLKAGMSNYYWSPDDYDVERWGDYSGIGNDPDGSVWVHSMYADSPSKEWTGRIGRLRY